MPDNNSYTKFAQNIRILRLFAKLSSEKAAQEIGIISGARLLHLEGKNVEPKADELMKISRYFGVSPEDLLEKTATIKFV